MGISRRGFLGSVSAGAAATSLAAQNTRGQSAPQKRAGQGKILSGPLETQIGELAEYLEGWRTQA